MDQFKRYLITNTKLSGRSLVTVPSGIRTVLKKLETDDFHALIDKKEQIKDILLGNSYSPATSNSYAMSIKHGIRFLNIGKEKESEIERFYSDISNLSTSAFKNAKNPNRQIKPRGVRTGVALEDYQKALQAVKQIALEDRHVPEYMPSKKRVPRVNIPDTAIPDQNLDIFQKINTFKKGLLSNKGEPIQDSSKELYAGNIKLVIERYNRHRDFKGKANLDFTIREVQKVIDWLDSLPITTRKAFETAIVKFLSLANGTVEEKQKAYEQYTEWLKQQEKHPTSKRKKEFRGFDYSTGQENVVFDWKTLQKNVDYLIKNDKKLNDMQKMFILLFTKIEPRRSKDYTSMIVSNNDDKIHNIYKKNTKQFIFNSYKNMHKTGPQTIDIKNESLIKSLNAYIEKHKKNAFLFEKNGKPLTKDNVQKLLRDDIGKRFKIPFGINAIRHMFATYLHEFKHPRDLDDYARKMGTSVEMLRLHYIDTDEKEMNESENEQEEEEDLSKVFETKPEKIARQKSESQKRIRSTPKGKDQMKKDNARRKDAKNAWARNKRTRNNTTKQ